MFDSKITIEKATDHSKVKQKTIIGNPKIEELHKHKGVLLFRYLKAIIQKLHEIFTLCIFKMLLPTHTHLKHDFSEYIENKYHKDFVSIYICAKAI